MVRENIGWGEEAPMVEELENDTPALHENGCGWDEGNGSTFRPDQGRKELKIIANLPRTYFN